MRVCRLCGEAKCISSFHKSPKGVDGHDTRCSQCKNKLKRERDSLPEVVDRNREYRRGDVYKSARMKRRHEAAAKKERESIDRVKESGGVYLKFEDAKASGVSRYNEGVVCKRGHVSERLVANRCCLECVRIRSESEDSKQSRRDYYDSNKTWLMQKNVENQRKRYQRDPEFKAASACRNMLKRVLTSTLKDKTNKTKDALGYTTRQLMDHIQSKFVDGMSWANYGDWHIDHIKPVSLFIKEGIVSPAIINALSNLQPLWAGENFAKSNKYER